ncbi:MAG: DUF2062 domain-containing protein [Giesbergeria sp.]
MQIFDGMSQARRFRSWLRHLEPRVLDSLNNRWLGRLRPWLDQHDVFSFTREPLARGIAIGMLCGLIPGPLQILGSLGICAWLRGNVIAAVIATAYTNPLTIVPLYWLAFQIGAFLLPGQQIMPPFVAPEGGMGDWAVGLGAWMSALGWPLLVGLPVLACLLAANAYALVQIFFLTPVIRRARRMGSNIKRCSPDVLPPH